MLYTHENARRATVIYAGRPITHVRSVDTETGVVTACSRNASGNLFVGPDGEVATHRMHFGIVHDIWAGQPQPVLFICYDLLRLQ